jgi:hypothetical protein
MEKYERLTLETSNLDKKESSLKIIGITPYIISILSILIFSVGIYAISKEIFIKKQELSNHETQLYIVTENFNSLKHRIQYLIEKNDNFEKKISESSVIQKNLLEEIKQIKKENEKYNNKIKELNEINEKNKNNIDNIISINEISNKEMLELYNKLQNLKKNNNSLILDENIDIINLKNWINNLNFSLNYMKICFNSHNDVLEEFENKCLKPNKSLLVLYQTINYERIGGFINRKNETSFLFNLNKLIKYDISNNLILFNYSLPSFGFTDENGPFDLKIFYDNFTKIFHGNTTLINEGNEHFELLDIEIYIIN